MIMAMDGSVTLAIADGQSMCPLMHRWGGALVSGYPRHDPLCQYPSLPIPHCSRDWRRWYGDGLHGTFHLQSRHAIKVLNSLSLVHEDIRDRFLAEGRIQAGLQHPNIASVTDIVVEPGVAGLVMEYLDGEAIDTYWHKHGRQLGEAGLIGLFKQILDGVGAAHAKGVHRDLKPDNILVVQDVHGAPQIKVLDFASRRSPKVRAKVRRAPVRRWEPRPT